MAALAEIRLVSRARLALAFIFFAGAAVVLIVAAYPTTFAAWLGFLKPAWLPILFDGFVLLGFVTAVTGLLAHRDLGLTAFSSLVIYVVVGVAIRWMSAAGTGQAITWTPEQVLVASVTWPSYLASYLIPRLWP